MMIKFSWKKINDKLDWDMYLVLCYFIKKNNEPFKPVFPLPDGSCYILNIKGLIDNLNHYSISDLYLYLELASKRSIFDYNIRGIKYLPLVLAEEYQLEQIRNSELFKVKNENIHFVYEETGETV